MECGVYHKIFLFVLSAGILGAAGAFWGSPAAWVRNGMLAMGITAVMPLIQRHRHILSAWGFGLLGALPAALAALLLFYLDREPGLLLDLPSYNVPAILILGISAGMIHYFRDTEKWSAWTVFSCLVFAGAFAFCIRNLPYAVSGKMFRDMVSPSVFAAFPMALVLTLLSVFSAKRGRSEWSLFGVCMTFLCCCLCVGSFFASPDFFLAGNLNYFAHFRKDADLRKKLDGCFRYGPMLVRFKNGDFLGREHVDSWKDSRSVTADGFSYFVKDGFIWKQDGGRDPEKLVRGTAVALHPHGGIIYFYRDRFFRLDENGVKQPFYTPRPLVPYSVVGAVLDDSEEYLFYQVNLVWFFDQHGFLTVARLSDGREFCHKPVFEQQVWPNRDSDALHYSEKPCSETGK